MDSHEPVEVYTTNNQNEAEIIRQALLGEGIHCEITGEFQAGMAGIGMFEIGIVTRAIDADRARAFIDEHRAKH